MLNVERLCVKKDGEFEVLHECTSAKNAGAKKQERALYEQRTQQNLQKLAVMQEKLYADGKEGVVVILQAMDAAGKDSAVKHVIGALNPQGVDIVSFKQPTKEELAHDYLWRAVRALPTRGKIAIFNRSYYEDVLVVQVHHLEKTYRMAERCIDDDFFEKRYRQIVDFERYLYENSYRVVKIFLNVSKERQKERFLERIDDPAKNWKFSQADLKERAHFESYQKAYRDVIDATAKRDTPWYVVPADQKWLARYCISEILVNTMNEINPEFPELSDEEKAGLAQCRTLLTADSQEEKEKNKK